MFGKAKRVYCDLPIEQGSKAFHAIPALYVLIDVYGVQSCSLRLGYPGRGNHDRIKCNADKSAQSPGYMEERHFLARS